MPVVSLTFQHLLSKIFQFTALPASVSDVMRRRERANAFCESIRALDATGLSIHLQCPQFFSPPQVHIYYNK
jgi:hypothetical protein